MSILSRIVGDVRRRVEEEKEANPINDLNFDRSDGRSLRGSILNSSDVSVIGELKRKSPSAGEIRPHFDPAELAKSMVSGGVAGISVLTEPKYFGGRPEYLKKVRDLVDLPVLRKDFIIDEYQLYSTAEMGADAVLLIAEVLGERVPEFVDLAKDLGMEPLVEIRDERQAELAESADAELVGVNNRNLKDFKVDLARTEELSNCLFEGTVLVSESGIESEEDVLRVLNAGADAVLVGTAIMEAPDVEGKVRSLVSGDEDG